MKKENKHHKAIFLMVLSAVFTLALFISLSANFLANHPALSFVVVIVVPMMFITGIFLLLLRLNRREREKSA
jgi:anaerobic C4-dicarboxylate transporter